MSPAAPLPALAVRAGRRGRRRGGGAARRSRPGAQEEEDTRGVGSAGGRRCPVISSLQTWRPPARDTRTKWRRRRGPNALSASANNNSSFRARRSRGAMASHCRRGAPAPALPLGRAASVTEREAGDWENSLPIAGTRRRALLITALPSVRLTVSARNSVLLRGAGISEGREKKKVRQCHVPFKALKGEEGRNRACGRAQGLAQGWGGADPLLPVPRSPGWCPYPSR